MLFIEGKWFYNYVLNLHKSNNIKFKDINSSNIKQIIRLDKNKNQINTILKYLGSNMKQSIIKQMQNNQKSIISLVKKGYQKYGQLHYIKQLKSIDLKQYGITHKIKNNKVRIQNIKGHIKVKRLQRKLKRQIKGSNNYYKTLNKLHKEYLNIQFKKKDYTNKLIHKLKQYSNIIIQDQQLNNWKKMKHGKAVQHSILGRVKAKLKQLSQTVVLDKFIPTSKYCSNCNHIKRHLKQYERIYKCNNCNYEYDRDINASINMVKIYQSMKNFVPVGCRDFKRVDFLKFINPIYID